MIETVATVRRNIELTPGYRLLTLSLDQPTVVLPGQFAMVRARAAFEPLLRRALAVYRQPGEREVVFLYQVLGRGTQVLASLGEGDEVDALLPLGNSWQHPTASGGAVVVAGGIGSASVLMLSESLKNAGVETQLFFGAASAQAALGCGLEDFRALGLPLTVTTDDGSLGERGLVTAALERHLEDRRGSRVTVYACGPWAMMKRVAEITAQQDRRCYVSLEAPMGCGFGVCVGCVVAVRAEGPPGYESYKRVCVDGTILPAEMIRWEVDAMAH